MTNKKTTPEKSAPAPVGGALYITEKAAAERFSVSVNVVSRLRRAGKIKAISIGPRLVRYQVESLDAYFTAHARGGEGKAGEAAVSPVKVWRHRRNLKPKAEMPAPGPVEIAATNTGANA